MIGELIRTFRKEKGMGVIELSKKLGINRISLFRIEKGQRHPSEKTAIEAFKTLGISEDNIYYIFVFNELLKWGAVSKSAKNKEAESFLKRLNKRDRYGKIIYGYFKKTLQRQTNVKKAEK